MESWPLDEDRGRASRDGARRAAARCRHVGGDEAPPGVGDGPLEQVPPPRRDPRSRGGARDRHRGGAGDLGRARSSSRSGPSSRWSWSRRRARVLGEVARRARAEERRCPRRSTAAIPARPGACVVAVVTSWKDQTRPPTSWALNTTTSPRCGPSSVAATRTCVVRRVVEGGGSDTSLGPAASTSGRSRSRCRPRLPSLAYSTRSPASVRVNTYVTPPATTTDGVPDDARSAELGEVRARPQIGPVDGPPNARRRPTERVPGQHEQVARARDAEHLVEPLGLTAGPAGSASGAMPVTPWSGPRRRTPAT